MSDPQSSVGSSRAIRQPRDTMSPSLASQDRKTAGRGVRIGIFVVPFRNWRSPLPIEATPLPDPAEMYPSPTGRHNDALGERRVLTLTSRGNQVSDDRSSGPVHFRRRARNAGLHRRSAGSSRRPRPGRGGAPVRREPGARRGRVGAHEMVGDPHRLGELQVRLRDRDPTSGEGRLGSLGRHRDRGCALEIHRPHVAPALPVTGRIDLVGPRA